MLDNLIVFLTNFRTLKRGLFTPIEQRPTAQPERPPIPMGPPMDMTEAIGAVFSLWKNAKLVQINGRTVEFTDTDRELMPKILLFCKSYYGLKSMNNPAVATAGGRRGLVDVLAEKQVLGDMTPIGADDPIAVQTTPTGGSCGCPTI